MKTTKGTPALFPELRGSIAGLRWPCFAEVKYDGEACLIGYDLSAPLQIFTSNKYGTMRYEWSKLDKIQSILEDHDIDKAVFLAELYHGDGKKGALYKLLSNKYEDDLNLAIYDVGYTAIAGVTMESTHTSLINQPQPQQKLKKTTILKH